VKPDGKPQYSGDRSGTGYEGIVACHAPGRSALNGGGSHGVYVVSRGNDGRTGHQTQKPLALMETLVRLFSNHGELILDPYAGSGTTGVAAVRLGRRFLGWEKDPGYAATARRRLQVARAAGMAVLVARSRLQVTIGLGNHLVRCKPTR
jgi:site-specific DNA-methyltransferase (adenine-specific)